MKNRIPLKFAGKFSESHNKVACKNSGGMVFAFVFGAENLKAAAALFKTSAGTPLPSTVKNASLKSL